MERKRRVSQPELCQYNPYENTMNQVRTFFINLLKGDSPPPTHYSMILLISVDIIIGMFLTVGHIMKYFNIYFMSSFFTYTTFFIGVVMLVPGLYEAWILGCCWKRVKGYDWWMIPHFDLF